MKKISFLLFLFFTLACYQQLEAKGVIVYHNGLKCVTQETLPADAQIDGKHVNLGVSFEQFGLFWLPLWNYGEVEYALISDDENDIWTLDEETLAQIKEEYNLDIPDEPSIPLWQQIGLKPVLLLLIIFIIWGQLPEKGEKEEDEEVASSEG